MNNDDLNTLVNTESTVLIGGINVIVKSLGFVAGLKFRVPLVPIIEQLLNQVVEDEEMSLELIGQVFDNHQDLLIQLMAESTGQTVEWVTQLGDNDGLLLLMEFWAVNAGFFVRRLVISGTTRRRENRSVGAKSLAL